MQKEKKLDDGLFMSGCSPYIYWYSWMTISFIRITLTTILSVLLSWAFIVPSTQFIVIFVTMATFGVYVVFFGLSLVIFIKKTKHLQSMLIWSAMVVALPVYLNLGVITDGSSTIPPVLTPSMTLPLSALFPGFAFCQLLSIMVMEENPVENGVRLGTIFTKTRLNMSFGVIFAAMTIGIGIQILIFFTLLKLNYGITGRESFEDNREDYDYSDELSQVTDDDASRPNSSKKSNRITSLWRNFNNNAGNNIFDRGTPQTNNILNRPSGSNSHASWGSHSTHATQNTYSSKRTNKSNDHSSSHDVDGKEVVVNIVNLSKRFDTDTGER